MTTLLIESVLRATALAATVWLVLRALRIRNPRLERSAWLLVLASSWTMPLLMKLLPLPAIAAQAPSWLSPVELTTASGTPAAANWRAALLWGALTIAIVLVLRHSLGVVRWHRVQRAARRISSSSFAGLDIRVTSGVNAPATVFASILVPDDFESWPLETQRAVIAHESTHVANKDFYVQWLAQLHRCVFWFSPLAWWLPNRLALLSEHISDDAALLETRERATYAEVLLGFAARRAIGSEHLVSMARGRSLGARIDRILTNTKPATTSQAKDLDLACCAIAARWHRGWLADRLGTKQRLWQCSG